MENKQLYNYYNHHFNGEIKHALIMKMTSSRNKNKRFLDVIKRFVEVADLILKNKEIWVLLLIWDANPEKKKKLLRAGFNSKLADNCLLGDKNDGIFENKYAPGALEDAEILYLRYANYSFSLIEPLIRCKAGYDLSIDETLEIELYIVSNENKPVFLNLYDDRGLEILTNNDDIVQSIVKKFKKYIRI